MEPLSASAARIDIEMERAKALDLIHRAQAVNPNSWYTRAEKTLRNMRIVVQSRPYGTCADYPSTAAFVDWFGDRSVYVCPPAVTAKYRHILPTTLIHEAVHAMGYYDECPAEKVEISVQNDLSLEVVDTLQPHCKIPIDYRITSTNIEQVGRAARAVPSRRNYQQPFVMAPASFNFGRGF